MNFKKGDKIRRINFDVDFCNPKMLIGEIYTFDTYEYSSNQESLYVEEIKRHIFDSHNFELVTNSSNTNLTPTTQKFKVGDILITVNLNKYKVISFNNGSYTLEDLTTGLFSSWNEYNINKHFTLVNNNIGYPPVSGVPWGSFTITSGVYDAGINPGDLMKIDTEFKPEIISSVRCECGSSKTYGENCGPEMHSNWCPKAKA